MAISAESITKSSTLEQLRTQFNNLVSDLTALEAGKAAFTEISTTTITGTAINVAEDGTIVFEGATNDDFETTLTVVDPTADRTISLPNTSGVVVVSGDGSFTVADGGTVGSTTTPSAITIASNGNITLSGDLTISGDDLFMGTNTAGLLLIADGTNFNPTAVTSLTAISSGDIVSGTDVLMIQDVDAGALKKVTVDNVFSSVGGLASVAGDSTPQLGGDLDVNGNGLVSTSNANIPLTPNGTGVVRIDGSTGVDIQQGAISIKNGGAESYIRFYCESANAHYTHLQASPHSAYSGNVTVVLPAAATNLVGDDTSQTLTNKTLTRPQINTAILPTSADGATLGSATKEFSDLFLADGGTIQFGNDQEITLTHVADSGLTLKHAATADDKFPTLTLQTGDTDIAVNDKLGVLNFQAPDEGTGSGDAILVAAGIEAVSEGDFSASNNATKLSFKTAASAAAAETMSLSSAGVLTTSSNIVSGGNVVIADAGNIGSASDTDSIAIASDGVVTFSQKGVHSASLSVKNGSTSAGFIEFFEDSDNGTNKVTLIGPASTSDVTLTLPAVTDTVATAGDITALAIALG